MTATDTSPSRDDRAPPAPAGGTQLLGVQYLRAAAALMVAYYHLGIQLPEYTPVFLQHLGGTGNLAAGVDIFFVISGFIMLVSNRSSSPRAFLARRIVRIVPLYWALTLAVALAVLVAPGLFRTTVLAPAYLLKSLFFLPYANPGHGGDLMPILVPGWSLNFEMFFYAWFALLLLLPAARRVFAAALVFLAILVAGRLAPEGSLPRELLFYADPRLLEFWLGMLIAHWFLRDRLDALPALLGGILALGGAVLIVLPAPTEPLATAQAWQALDILAAGLVVLGAIVLERRGCMPRLPWLHWLGDASYSMYLSHVFTLGLARTIWVRAGLGAVDLAHAIGFAVFAMACVIAGTWLCYSFLEQPLLRWFQQRMRGRTRTA